MGAPFDLNALSGINAASNGLAVISNNLANSQTVGFKSSRAEFADMFSGPQSSAGNGVRVGAITQDFTQGTVQGTGRDLDMAIDGEGFFVLKDQTGKYDNVYTRNGSFKLDKEGFLTSQEGNQVQGYLLNETLSTETTPVFDTILSSIDLDALNKRPKATDEMTFDINLDGQEQNNTDPTTNASVGNQLPAPNSLVKLTDPANNGGAYGGSPDFSTNKIIHDSLGGEHRLTANFYKRDVVTQANSDVDANGNTVAPPNGVKYTSWIVQYTMEDKDADGNYVTSGHRANAAGAATPDTGMIYELRFDTNGNLIDTRQPNIPAGVAPVAPVGQDAANTPLPNGGWGGTQAGDKNLQMTWIVDTPLTGASDPLGDPTATVVEIDVDMTEMTQFAGSYKLDGVSQNGFKIGDLVGISTGLDGVIEARYSNGRSIPVAKLGIANFSDKNAMEKLGGQTYAESFASGTVQLGTPQNNGFGTINAGSLEYSNVDTAGELVNMIQTQRTYQASAQVIQTSQTLTQTILQL